MSRQQAKEKKEEENTQGCQDNVMNIVTRLWAGWSRVRNPSRGKRFLFLFSRALGTSQPPIKWALSFFPLR
jgi:hypothetical protein